MAKRERRNRKEDQTANKKPNEDKEDDEPKKPKLQTQLDVLLTNLTALLAEENQQLAYSDGTFWLYDFGYWRAATADDMQALTYMLAELSEMVGLVFAKDNKVVWTHLKSERDLAIDTGDLDQEQLVAVRNGTVDIKSGELLPHDPDHMTTRFVNITYKAGAECPEWIALLDRVFDDREKGPRDELISFIQEWFGMALAGGATNTTPRDLQKALFLYGPKRTGKSTILKVAKELLGSEKIVAKPPSEVTTQFGLESFLGASAWITEELDGLGRSLDTSRVKALITGEALSVPRKMKTDALMSFRGPVLWAGNSQPNFSESSGAVYDRTVVIAMDRCFSPKEAKQTFGRLDPIAYLQRKKEFPGIFLWALEGYKRAIKRGGYDVPEEAKLSGSDWRRQNDPIFAFLVDCCEYDGKLSNPVKVITAAAAMHSLEANAPRLPTAKVQTRIAAVIPELFPEVSKDRIRYDGVRPWVFSGLALNEMGKQYFEIAEKNNEALAGLELLPNLKIIAGQDGS